MREQVGFDGRHNRPTVRIDGRKAAMLGDLNQRQFRAFGSQILPVRIWPSYGRLNGVDE